MFLAENLKTRKDKAAETYLFLTDETKKLEDRIGKSSKALAEFKEKHAKSLPKMSAMNLSMLNRTESELDGVILPN